MDIHIRMRDKHLPNRWYWPMKTRLELPSCQRLNSKKKALL